MKVKILDRNEIYQVLLEIDEILISQPNVPQPVTHLKNIRFMEITGPPSFSRLLQSELGVESLSGCVLHAFSWRVQGKQNWKEAQNQFERFHICSENPSRGQRKRCWEKENTPWNTLHSLLPHYSLNLFILYSYSYINSGNLSELFFVTRSTKGETIQSTLSLLERLFTLVKNSAQIQHAGFRTHEAHILVVY